MNNNKGLHFQILLMPVSQYLDYICNKTLRNIIFEFQTIQLMIIPFDVPILKSKSIRTKMDDSESAVIGRRVGCVRDYTRQQN